MREIAASDDDDSDFDHIDAPINDGIEKIQDAPAPAPEQHNEAQERHQSHHDESNVSTDLSYFQRVYDEQRAATIAGTYMGTNVTTQGHKPASKSDQPSSITDPVPASRRPQKRKIGDNIIDLTDLTQVTTPRKSGDGKRKTTEGVATGDAPQEPSLVQQAVRTYGKRKQADPAQPSPEQEEELPRQSIVRLDPYEFPDDGDDDYTIPPLPKKKTKTTAKRTSQASTSSLPVRQPDATPDHDDISFIPLPPAPSEDVPSSVVQLRSYQKPISSEENPSTSSVSVIATQRLYIAPSTLMASQKEEYRIVSLSTQGTQDNLVTQDNLSIQENIPPQSSLPAVPPSDPYPTQIYGEGLLYAGAGTTYKSSGMTTVVPSNLSEIIRGINGDGAPDAAVPAMMTSTSGLGSGSLEMGTPARVRTNFPASSPDIIGGGSPQIRTSGRKRKVTQTFEEDITESLESNRLAEIREMSAEDNADYTLDTMDTHQQSTILGNNQVQNEEVNEQTTDATASSSTVKKKRGRKKKEPVQMVTEDETVLNNSLEATAYQQPEEASATHSDPAEPEQPPPKRRRGRPRKSDVAATQKAPKQPTPEPEVDDGDELASLTPTTGRKRGVNSNNTRKRKASTPIVIDDSESDGGLSVPPEEIPEEEDPFEAEPEIPPSNEDEDEEEQPPRKRGKPAAAAPPPTTTKGKRGRPPKNKVVKEVSASSTTKNSRAKSKFQIEDSEDDDDQDQDLKKDLEGENDAERNDDTREGTTPVPDAKPTPSPKPTTKEEENDDKDNLKKEKDNIIKPTSFLSTQGKVNYRVGLSKRSRVASLLKVVPRKQ